MFTDSFKSEYPNVTSLLRFEYYSEDGISLELVTELQIVKFQTILQKRFYWLQKDDIESKVRDYLREKLQDGDCIINSPEVDKSKPNIFTVTFEITKEKNIIYHGVGYIENIKEKPEFGCIY